MRANRRDARSHLAETQNAHDRARERGAVFGLDPNHAEHRPRVRGVLPIGPALDRVGLHIAVLDELELLDDGFAPLVVSIERRRGGDARLGVRRRAQKLRENHV